MHDIVLIQDLKSFQQLFKDPNTLLLTEFGLLFEFVLKGSPIAILIDKIKVVLRLVHLHIPDDVRTRFYLR